MSTILLFFVISGFFLLPPLSYGGPRGMTRDFDLTYETRETTGTDKVNIDRFTFNSNFGWELTRRSELDISIPFCVTSADFEVNPLDDDTIAAFKDIKANYRMDVREATEDKPGAFYSLFMNIATGLSNLNADEQAIINAINEASEGFTDPAYTNGFGFRAMYGLTFKQGANSNLDLSLGYHYTGTFEPSDGYEENTSDNILLRLAGRRQVNPRRDVQYGLSYMYFFDGKLTTLNTGDTTTTKRDADMSFFFATNTELNPNLSNSIDFSYIYRNEQDYVDAGGTTGQRLDLGDIIRLRAMQHQKMNPKQWFDYGLAWRLTQNSDALTGAPVDTRRNELGVVLGLTKDVNTGFTMKGDIQIGLTDDSRDFVLNFGGMWSF